MAAPRRKWSERSYASAAVEAARKANEPAQERYVTALRSRAPGQPTDGTRLEQSRHQMGVVHVAIKVLGDQAAAAALHVKRRKDDAGESPGQDDAGPVPATHPLARLLRRPNNKETGGMLRRRWVQQLCLTGESLTWRLDDGLGVPAELWSIESGTWTPLAMSEAYPEGGYRVTPRFAYGPFLTAPGLMGPGGAVIDSRHIIRASFPHPLVSYDAYSPLTACAVQLDSLEAVERSRWYGMRQGITPSATLEVEGDMDPAEVDRIREEYRAKFGGPQNVGNLAVITGGGKLNPYSHSPADMGWATEWGQLADFVLSVFGTTKTLAFMGEASSYAALYASLKQFNVLSLRPLLQLLADVININLVWPYWGEEYYVEYEPAAIDDQEFKLQVMQALSAIGAITVNEYRTELGLTAVPWGDRPAVPGGQADDMAKAGLMDLDPSNDGQMQDMPGQTEGGLPRGQAPQARAARPAPGRQSEGSLPGKELAGMGLNGRH